MTDYFCTYLDARYLSRGLALYTSLAEHIPEFHLYVLCMDTAAARVLRELQLSSLTVVDLGDLEQADPDLAAVRPTRSRIEYYFTSTPSWILFALGLAGSTVTYVDADVHLFSDPHPALGEVDGAAVTIVPHRFPTELAHLLEFGRFNVGWLTFSNDVRSQQVLAGWREQCIDWCYDRVDDERFADQKYLDAWPTSYSFVHVLRHPGVNVAPWNVLNHEIAVDGDQVRIDGQPLVAFHFHRLRKMAPRLYDPRLDEYGVRISELLRRWIYEPYLERLETWERLVLAGTGIPLSNIREGGQRGVRERIAGMRLLLQRRASGNLISTKRHPADAAVRSLAGRFSL